MSSKSPPTTRYQAVVRAAQQHTVAGLIDELITTDATIQQVLVALEAFTAGLSREEIIIALIEGEAQGMVRYGQPASVQAEPEDAWTEQGRTPPLNPYAGTR